MENTKSEEAARAHVVFSGQVQGVFFRAFTEETARSLNLAGWARNMPGGSVEAVFEGNREIIEEAIARCTKGPPTAHVEKADTRWEKATGEFSYFTIKYY